MAKYSDDFDLDLFRSFVDVLEQVKDMIEELDAIHSAVQSGGLYDFVASVEGGNKALQIEYLDDALVDVIGTYYNYVNDIEDGLYTVKEALESAEEE